MSRGVAFAAVIVALALTGVPDTSALALAPASPWWTRLTYHWPHAHILHAAANSWALLTIAFVWRPPLVRMLTALALACTIPSALLTAPVVGMSGWVYALIGLQTPRAGRPWRFFACGAAMCAVSFVLPGVAAWVHLWAYAAALCVALLTAPVICRR